jgi:glycosyltransferase involved in cell wall biosynthesis
MHDKDANPRLPPKLLHVVGDSKYGGGSVLIVRLATAAQKAGWLVKVLSTDPTFGRELARHGIGVEPLDVIRRAIRPLNDVFGLAKLVRYLRRQQFDLIHTHTSKAGLLGRAAAYAAGVPGIVHTVHGFAFHDFTRTTVLKAIVGAERLAARCCDRIVTVSEFHREVALAHRIGRPDQVIAIPNGLQPSRITEGADRAQVRASLRVGDQDILLLAVGRLAKQKGFEYSIKAVDALRRQGLKVVLAIAGEGEERKALEDLCTSNGTAAFVRLLGFRTDLGDLLSAADIVVLPSLWEGLSLALLEGMAAAKPIVTTAIGSNVEVTRNGSCAVLVPPASTPDLVSAITSLVASPARADALGRSAREMFVRHYTEEAMLGSYLQLYADLLRGKKAHVEVSCARDVAC